MIKKFLSSEFGTEFQMNILERTKFFLVIQCRRGSIRPKNHLKPPCNFIIIILPCDRQTDRYIDTPPHTHTHTRLTALFPGLPRWAGTKKVEPIWILLKQETVSGSGISWARCKSAPCSRQITTTASHHSVFYRPDALPATQSTASKHWREHRYQAIANMSGDQKVLQLGYKKLTYHITHAVIFWHILVQHQCIFSTVYALKIEFSVLTLRPCLHSDLQ